MRDLIYVRVSFNQYIARCVSIEYMSVLPFLAYVTHVRLVRTYRSS